MINFKIEEMSGAREAAVAEVRKGSVTCPVMTDGRSRRSHERVAAEVTVGTRTVAEVEAEDVGMITNVMRMTGLFLYPETSVSKLNSSVLVTPESTSASMKIYLLKQPVIKCRVTLHL